MIDEQELEKFIKGFEKQYEEYGKFWIYSVDAQKLINCLKELKNRMRY